MGRRVGVVNARQHRRLARPSPLFPATKIDCSRLKGLLCCQGTTPMANFLTNGNSIGIESAPCETLNFAPLSSFGGRMAIGLPLFSMLPCVAESQVFFAPPAQRVVLRDRFSGTKEELARLRREAIDIRERLADENEGRGYWFANAPLYSYPVEVLPFSGDQDFALDSLSPFPAELTDKDLASNRPHEDQPDPSLCEGSKSPGPCEWEPLPGSPLLALQAFTQLRGHLSESLTCFIELLTWALRSLFVAPLPPQFDCPGTFQRERSFFRIHGMGRPPRNFGWAC